MKESKLGCRNWTTDEGWRFDSLYPLMGTTKTVKIRRAQSNSELLQAAKFFEHFLAGNCSI